MTLIVELAKKGDAYAVDTLKETAHYLGLGLAPVIYALNPDVIIIGGKIVGAWSVVEGEIRSSCAQRVSRPFLDGTNFWPTTMQTRPGLMGAISFVLAQSFASPHTPVGPVAMAPLFNGMDHRERP